MEALAGELPARALQCEACLFQSRAGMMVFEMVARWREEAEAVGTGELIGTRGSLSLTKPGGGGDGGGGGGGDPCGDRSFWRSDAAAMMVAGRWAGLEEEAAKRLVTDSSCVSGCGRTTMETRESGLNRGHPAWRRTAVNRGRKARRRRLVESPQRRHRSSRQPSTCACRAADIGHGPESCRAHGSRPLRREDALHPKGRGYIQRALPENYILRGHRILGGVAAGGGTPLVILHPLLCASKRHSIGTKTQQNYKPWENV